MCRYAWVSFKKIFLLFVWWVILVFWGLMTIGSISDKFAYIQKRFTYFLSYKDIDPQNKQIWRQNEQALMAIGWWWFWGRWYWKWLQKFWYIPEAQSDFVFAAYSEEIWFAWNMVLLWLYFYLLYYFISKLHQVKDEYSKLIWLWIISLIIVQMFVNIWVNTKIMPNTWITLPFISYWWTAIMVNVIEIVLLYKILKGK
jgi:cell division protein FtsW (lipid II flippase)